MPTLALKIRLDPTPKQSNRLSRLDWSRHAQLCTDFIAARFLSFYVDW